MTEEKPIDSRKLIPLNKQSRVISKRFSDVEPEDQQKELTKYLHNTYLKGFDFMYVRIQFTDNVMEKSKIQAPSNNSRKVKEVIPITKIITEDDNKRHPKSMIGKSALDLGEETGNSFVIKIKSEFSKEFNDLFLLRLENERITGPNEVHINRQYIKECLDSLIIEHRALIYLLIIPGKVIPELAAKQTELRNLRHKNAKNNNYTEWKNKKDDAYEELIKIIIDNEREYMVQELGLYTGDGNINQKRVEYVIKSMPDEVQQKKSKAWHKKRANIKKK